MLTPHFLLTMPMTPSLTMLLKTDPYSPGALPSPLLYNFPTIFLLPVPVACSHSLEQLPVL